MEDTRMYIVEMPADAMSYLLDILEPLAVSDTRLGDILEVFDDAYLASGEIEIDLLDELELKS